MSRLQGARVLPDLAILAGAFLVVQLALALLLPASLQGNDSSDFRDVYYPIAQRLAAGVGLAEAHHFAPPGPSTGAVVPGPDVFVTRFPPGYPILLSRVIVVADLVGIRHSVAFAAMTALFALANALLLYLILRVGLRSRMAATVGSLCWMAYPPAAFLLKQPNSENPFLTALFAAILLQLATKPGTLRAVCIGVCLGAAIYIRLAGLFLPIVFVAVLVGERLLLPARRGPVLGGIIATIAIPCLLVAPWVWLIYAETGQFVPVASTGADLLRLSYSELRRSVPANSWLWSDSLRAYVAQRAAGDAAGSAPMELRLLGVKTLRAFYGTFTLRQEPVLITLQLGFFTMAAIGFLRTWRDRSIWLFHLTAWMIFGYFLATSAVGIPLVRYTLPGQALLTGYVAITAMAVVATLLGTASRRLRVGHPARFG